jgi:hypothetical protein
MRTSSFEASSSMIAPRPSAAPWWIGMELVPSTDRDVDRDIFELSARAPKILQTKFWRRSAGLRYCFTRHGYEVVNTRNELTIGLPPPAGSPPAEWQVSDGLWPMTARSAP